MTTGIPTYAQKFLMRSRLEARWAGFFTELGWQWEYEPVDFNGWIPDFVLFGKSGNTYVEVKPVTEFPQEVADQIDGSGCKDEVLIVGLGLNLGQRGYEEQRDRVRPPLGWMREMTEYTDGHLEPWWQDAHFHSLGGMGFHPDCGSWVNRITGAYDGDQGSFAESYGDSPELLREAWARACNKMQWKAAR